MSDILKAITNCPHVMTFSEIKQSIKTGATEGAKVGGAAGAVVYAIGAVCSKATEKVVDAAKELSKPTKLTVPE